MKRCVIDKNGRFRISKPGFDVDTASLENMLLHESFFYSQPFLFRFVPCPYSGTSSSNRDQNAPTITFSNPGTLLPSVLLFSVGSGNVVTFPMQNAISTPQTGGVVAVPGWDVTHSVTSSSVTVRFYTFADTPAPSGAYLVLFRRG